jgi:hypothetical protein
VYDLFGEFDPRDVYCLFGKHDPRQMPPHFFWRHLGLDYASAIKADTSKQDFSVAPRHWYIDAVFQCDRCHEKFCFSAAEQRAWYEDYKFWVDSCPRECQACRRELRRLKSLRQEYDREIAQALTCKELDLKVRIASIIDQLCDAGITLPEKVHENRKVLAKQIARRSGPSTV